MLGKNTEYVLFVNKINNEQNIQKRNKIQLFRERLSDERVKFTRQDRTVVWVFIEILHTYFQLIRPFFCSFSFTVTWLLVEKSSNIQCGEKNFVSTSVKKMKTYEMTFAMFLNLISVQRELHLSTSTHTNFRGCRVHLYALFRQPFSKQLYTIIIRWISRALISNI